MTMSDHSETARKLVERLMRKSEEARALKAHERADDTIRRAILDRDNAKAALLEYIGELESEIVRETSDREAADCLHNLQYTLHEIEGVKADIEWAMKALGRMLQHDAADPEPTPETFRSLAEWADDPETPTLLIEKRLSRFGTGRYSGVGYLLRRIADKLEEVRDG